MHFGHEIVEAVTVVEAETTEACTVEVLVDCSLAVYLTKVEWQMGWRHSYLHCLALR